MIFITYNFPLKSYKKIKEISSFNVKEHILQPTTL